MWGAKPPLVVCEVMMGTKQFLQDVIPQGGEYYICFQNNDTESWQEFKESSLADMIKRVITEHPENKNIFFGPTAYTITAQSRAKPYVLSKQAFYLDLDVEQGKFKKYETREEAIASVNALVDKGVLPKPSYTVDSGRGVHVYWCLHEPIDVNEWCRIALKLKSLCTQHHIKQDPAVTADPARVLRLPGTINQKSGRRCALLSQAGVKYSTDDIEHYLKGLKGDNLIWMVGADGKPLSDLYDQFGDGTKNLITTDGSPKYFAEVVKSCAVAKEQLDTAGKNAGYKLWFQMMNLLVFCEDGEDYAMAISSAHPDFEIAKAKSQYETSVFGRDSGSLKGGTTCEAFHEECASVCESCPAWSDPERGKSWSSPLRFGYGLVPAEVATKTLPFTFEYIHGGKGIQQIVNGKEAGTMSLVVNEVEVLMTPDKGETALFMHSTVGKKEKKTFIPGGLITGSTSTFGSALGAQGVMLNPKEYQVLARLLVAWHEKVLASKGPRPLLKQYGWLDFDGVKGFAVGEDVFWEDGTAEKSRGTDPTLAASLEAKGSMEGWKKNVAKALKAEHIETEVLIAASFASPLIKFTSVSSCVLSAVSPKSGTGKSLAIKLGQAVWGDPAMLVNSMNDTPNSITKKLGTMNNLPSYWDELRVHGKEGIAFVNFIYRFTQGRDKGRLTQHSTIMESPAWRTMLVCASNTGVLAHVRALDTGTNAGAFRVMEFDVTPLNMDKAHDPHDFADVDYNYGWAGRVYAEFVASNNKLVRELVKQCLAKYVRVLGVSSDSRFLVATVATILAGAIIAKKIELVDFNIKKLEEFLVKTLKESLCEIKEETALAIHAAPINALAAFIKDHQANVLVLAGAGGGVSGGETDENISVKASITRAPVPGHAIFIRMNDYNNTMVIDFKALSVWAQAKSLGGLRPRYLSAIKGLVIKPVRMGGGIPPHIAPERGLTRCLYIKKTVATAALFDVGAQENEKNKKKEEKKKIMEGDGKEDA